LKRKGFKVTYKDRFEGGKVKLPKLFIIGERWWEFGNFQSVNDKGWEHKEEVSSEKGGTIYHQSLHSHGHFTDWGRGFQKGATRYGWQEKWKGNNLS